MIETLHIGNAPDDKLTITLSGKVDAVMGVLLNGLPLDDLQVLSEAISSELERRKTSGDSDAERVV